VFPTLIVLGCEVVLLEAQDPVDCLSIHKYEAQQLGQGKMVNAQVKLMSITAFVKVFQCHHGGQ
jgi:hypothetical protein